MSFVYEVNLEINQTHASEFATWLEPHIQEMLQFKGFLSAQWFKRDPMDEQRSQDVVLWTIHYSLVDAESFSLYLQNHADRMRAEGLRLFGGQFTASRRLLHTHKQYSSPQ